jgi:hypothetical protein
MALPEFTIFVTEPELPSKLVLPLYVVCRRDGVGAMGQALGCVLCRPSAQGHSLQERCAIIEGNCPGEGRNAQHAAFLTQRCGRDSPVAYDGKPDDRPQPACRLERITPSNSSLSAGFWKKATAPDVRVRLSLPSGSRAVRTITGIMESVG